MAQKKPLEHEISAEIDGVTYRGWYSVTKEGPSRWVNVRLAAGGHDTAIINNLTPHDTAMMLFNELVGKLGRRPV